MPDDELFRAAKEQRLSTAEEVSRQVKRMMLDQKIKSLCTDFGMQWLKIKKVLSAVPDRDLFPQYYKRKIWSPGHSMIIEQLLLFETILVEDRSILEFVHADYGYLNRQLMDWYGIPPEDVLAYRPQYVDYEDFFRIKWPSSHRGGAITSGAMLLSTSTPVRTSPVYRGNWILNVILNDPPPPPPAAVPAIDEKDAKKNRHLNIREKLEMHKLDSACASCHDRIDPVGFPLERYDPVGRWRNRYANGERIDTNGRIVGKDFDGGARLKLILARERVTFVRAFVKHVMRYALGRDLHFTDEPAITTITNRVIKQNCRFSAVIREIVLSRPFREMTTPAEAIAESRQSRAMPQKFLPEGQVRQ